MTNGRFEQFKERSRKRYGEKYDYSEFEYVNAKTPSVIICSTHGIFLQKPDHHLRANSIGCPGCVLDNKKQPKKNPPTNSKKPISESEYRNRLVTKYGDKFEIDTSLYLGISSGKVGLSCAKHGKQWYSPAAPLMSSAGCNICGKEKARATMTKSYADLVEEVAALYGTDFTLLEENVSTYVDRKSNVKVQCKKHGVFTKKAQKLLSGQACWPCKIADLCSEGRLPGGYSEQVFLERPDLRDKPAILYYLQVNGSIYKVGVTTTSVADRIKGLKSKAAGEILEIAVLSSVSSTLELAYYAEQEILTQFKSKRKYTKWSTELFKEDVLKERSLSDFINLHIPTNT